MKWDQLSLRIKLLLASVVVEVVMLTMLVTNSVVLSQESLVEQARQHSRELSPLLNAAFAAPLAQRDYTTLRQILKEARQKDNLRYIAVIDFDGRLLASEGWDLNKPFPALDVDIGALDPDDGSFDVALPVQIAGQVLGTVRYGRSASFLAEAKDNLLRQSMVIAGAEIFLTLLLLASIGYLLTRRLDMLTESSRRVAAGDFEVTLPVQGDDELSQLTVAFNQMAATIKSRIAELTESERLQRQYLRRANDERSRMVSLLTALSTGILFVNRHNRVVYFNPAFSRIWGIPHNPTVVGQPVDDVLRHSTMLGSYPDLFQRHFLVAGKQMVGDDVREVTIGDGRVISQRVVPVRDESGELGGRLWVFEDVTHHRENAQLLYLAERDSLTGLYNRRRFNEELSRVLTSAQRSQSTAAVLFIDLDEFKHVNDTFGHRVGDAILIRVSRELASHVRKNEFLARMGGDEFAVLMSSADADAAEHLASRIVRAVPQVPFQIEGRQVRLGCSVGVALTPLHGTGAEELLANADAAMYQAKSAGRNAWRVFRAEEQKSSLLVENMAWSYRVREALDDDRMRLHVQGVFDVHSRELRHMEALVRIAGLGDTRELFMPQQFISAAESTGAIYDIDRWVIRESVRLLAALPHVPAIAVNVSGRTVDNKALPQFIIDQLSSAGVEPRRLMVELTETSIVADLYHAQQFIDAIHSIGCLFCIDDFGSGYSSFAYIKSLDADIIKIDRAFTSNLAGDRHNRVLVKAVIDIARGLDKLTIAEAVEDEETLGLLRSLGVDMVQGNYLGKPADLGVSTETLAPALAE